MKDSSGKKSVNKYSITDSQNAFMYFGTTAAAVDQHLQKLLSTSENIQPFIIIVGPDVFQVEEILIYFDGIKYKFFNILNAIDICFKIFHLFNLKYPLQCEAVWQFIQQHFYKIKNSKESTYPSVKILQKHLTNCK